MTDLTKITTPYGLLDKETQEALDRARKDGKTILRFEGSCWVARAENDIFVWSKTYRVKPEPVVETQKARMTRQGGKWMVTLDLGGDMDIGTLTTELDRDTGRPVRAVWEADE